MGRWSQNEAMAMRFTPALRLLPPFSELSTPYNPTFTTVRTPRRDFEEWQNVDHVLNHLQKIRSPSLTRSMTRL